MEHPVVGPAARPVVEAAAQRGHGLAKSGHDLVGPEPSGLFAPGFRVFARAGAVTSSDPGCESGPPCRIASPGEELSTTSSVSDPIEEPIDGRTARRVRTRAAIVDACISLVEGGEIRPTAPRIAEVAGVSVRSVFQHFDDLDTLFVAVGSRMASRVVELIVPIDAGQPLEERLNEFVDQRSAINELVTPIRSAAMVHAPTSAAIGAMFRQGHEHYREQIRTVFAAELAEPGIDLDMRVTAVMVAASWNTWNLLRSMEQRSVEETRTAVLALLGTAFRAG